MANNAEASGRTIEAAVAAAAAQLGLRADQVEVEILEEPVPSTFGRIGFPARVRVAPRGNDTRSPAPAPAPAPVSPIGAAPEAMPEAMPEALPHPAEPGPERSGRPPMEPRRNGGRNGGRSEPPDVEVVDEATIEADTELAGDFVEGLLDVLDLDGDITTWADAQGGHVEIEGSGLGVLVGTDGETLAALQELTRLAVLRQRRHRVRLTVDVDGFKRRRREQLVVAAQAAAVRVLETGEDEELQPMPAFERKIVHDVVAATNGLMSESLGEEPHRRVLIRRA